MNDPLEHVAIIGAGIGGCALALLLSSHNIAVTIHESRAAQAESYISGVLLTPNGLRILDELNVLARIRSKCYRLTGSTFKNDRDETIREIRTADPNIHGYNNHRLWRQILLDEMTSMLAERGVLITFSSQFTTLVSCSASHVTYTTTNPISPTDPPLSHSCSLLIAADGVHSTLRTVYVAPNVQPTYTGTLGIASHLRRSSIPLPESSYPTSQATIQGSAEALFFIAEDPSPDPILFIGMQMTYPLESRAEAAELQRDKTALASCFRKGYESWPEGSTVRRIVDEVCREENRERLFLWAYERMPPLAKWFEEKTGRIVLMGDAAHVVPPSSGQGASLALEDAASLMEILKGVSKWSRERKGEEVTHKLVKSLEFWQETRQTRVDDVFEWTTNSQNVDRMPKAEREKAIAAINKGDVKGPGIGAVDMTWLYNLDCKKEVERWIEEQAW